jgi:hypothetical protein
MKYIEEKTYSMSVLITHAHNRLAYYAARCLAKHGIKITCASDSAPFFTLPIYHFGLLIQHGTMRPLIEKY